MKYSILDYDLSFLQNLVHIIDQHLKHINTEAAQVDDPDSLGYFDNMEQIIGLGFVACQTYLSSVYSYLKIEKKRALAVGPYHSSGQSKAQLINHAANYWKHNSEWVFDKNSKQRMFVEKAFESVGFPVNTDYPLLGILAEVALPENAAFEPVISVLEAWKDELQVSAS
jgi:hypothetical protein